MAGRFSVSTVFTAIDRITAPVQRMQSKIGSFTRSTERNFRRMNRSINAFNSSIKNIAVISALSLSATGAAMAGVVNTGADFEQSIVNAAAKFPNLIDNTDKFNATLIKLGDAAAKTGKTTEFTARSSAEALNFLAMAGFNAEQAISALPVVVNLATASQTDLARATDIATDTMGAFGLASSDAVQQTKNLTRVSDVLARTSTASNTSMGQLFEAMKKGGPIATQAGASIEEVAALIGTMANAGIKAEIAGTAVSNAFLNLSKPTGMAVKVIDRLKLQVSDASGAMRPMADIIDDLNAKTKNFTETQKLATIETIFGREGLAGTMNVISEGGDKLRDFIKLNEQATGTSKKMSDVMRGTVRGSVNSLKSAIEGISISIFGMNRGAIKEAIDKTTEWVRANESLISSGIGSFMLSIIENMDKYITIAKQISGVIVLWAGLTVALKIATAATVIFNTVSLALSITIATLRIAVMSYTAIVAGIPAVLGAARIAVLAFNLALALNPIGLIVTAIGLLVAAAASIYLAWDPVTEFFKDLWDTIKRVTSGIGDAMRDFGEFFGFVDSNEKKLAQITPLSAPLDESQREMSLSELKPQVVSQSDKVSKVLTESNTTSNSEITLKLDKGVSGEVTKGRVGTGLNMIQSGAM